MSEGCKHPLTCFHFNRYTLKAVPKFIPAGNYLRGEWYFASFRYRYPYQGQFCLCYSVGMASVPLIN